MGLREIPEQATERGSESGSESGNESESGIGIGSRGESKGGPEVEVEV
jgi:hypothetical protein